MSVSLQQKSTDTCFESPWYNHTGWLGVKHQFTYLPVFNQYTYLFSISDAVHYQITTLRWVSGGHATLCGGTRRTSWPAPCSPCRKPLTSAVAVSRTWSVVAFCFRCFGGGLFLSWSWLFSAGSMCAYVCVCALYVYACKKGKGGRQRKMCVYVSWSVSGISVCVCVMYVHMCVCACIFVWISIW